MLAFFMVLVLTVGGWLAWRAAPARPVQAVDTFEPRSRRRKISRDAVVRRSPFYASRAPGPLCERASGLFSHRADGRAPSLSRRLARIGARALDPARFTPTRC